MCPLSKMNIIIMKGLTLGLCCLFLVRVHVSQSRQKNIYLEFFLDRHKSSFPHPEYLNAVQTWYKQIKMDLVLRQRQPSEGFTSLASGRFIVDNPPETLCFLAAASCSVSLFGIEILGSEELIVPVASLDVFGNISAIACLPQSGGGDLALVLLKTGHLKVLRYQDAR
jgi:hypothetical protein